MHTHPNSNSFSSADISAASKLGVNGYVVGSNLELQRYNLDSNTVSKLGLISPILLTERQRAELVSEFQISWEKHVGKGCDFNCGEMIWPTS